MGGRRCGAGTISVRGEVDVGWMEESSRSVNCLNVGSESGCFRVARRRCEETAVVVAVQDILDSVEGRQT